jgi:hypothetical protein
MVPWSSDEDRDHPVISFSATTRLWKYLEHGEVPEGAAVGSWETKLNNQPVMS